MHRTMRKNSTKAASLLLGLTLGGSVWGQAAPSAPPATPVAQAPGKDAVPQAAPLVVLPPPTSQNPPKPGDAPNGPVPQAPVPRPPEQPVLRPGKIVLSIGGSQKVQALSKKKILKATSPQPNVVRISPIEGDPTSVLLTGLESGAIRITLIDEDKNEEQIDVLVQVDVEYLKTVLKMAAPTSAITPIPGTNNTIILTGWVAHSEEVEAIVKATAGVVGGMDKVTNLLRVGGVMQVQLDVAIALVSRDKMRFMNFNFINDGVNHVLASTIGSGFQIPSPAAVAGVFPANSLINIAPVGTPGGNASNLFLGVFNSKQDFYGLLQALKTESLAKELAWPSLICMSGKSASFQSGGQQAVPVPSGLGQIGIQYQPFGTTLEVLPIVLGNGRIYLDIKPGVSSLNAANGTTISGTTVPGLNVQSLHTTVELEPGQSMVLGGLVQRDVQATTSKIPVLGELPYLGAAFSSKSFDETETELLICVTANLVDSMSCDQAPKVLPGEETRSPDDFELFLEGIMEAPRGPRQVFHDHHYVPAYKNGPTASTYPCAGAGNCGASGCTTPVAGVVGSPAPSGVVAGKTQASDPAPVAASLQAPTPTDARAPVTDFPAPTVLPPTLPSSRGGPDR